MSHPRDDGSTTAGSKSRCFFFLGMSAGAIQRPHHRQNDGAQTIQETHLPQPFKPEAATMISATECCNGGGGVYGGRISGLPKFVFVVLTMLRCSTCRYSTITGLLKRPAKRRLIEWFPGVKTNPNKIYSLTKHDALCTTAGQGHWCVETNQEHSQLQHAQRTQQHTQLLGFCSVCLPKDS